LPSESLFTNLERARIQKELDEAKRRLRQATVERQAREARDNR